MQKLIFVVLYIFPFLCFAQADSTVVLQPGEVKRKKQDESPEMKVFYSQKVINTNTVEVLPKGILEFRVSHAFGDIGGRDGGVKTFFGLDGTFDVRIGFQLGLTNKLNLIVARDKGASNVGKLYELGLKYQFLKQQENDPSHPVSLTVFANSVVSSVKAGDVTQETAYDKFSDRTSEVVQVLLAKKFGKISVQLNPLFLTRGYAVPGDDKNLFAMGAAIRIPLTAKFIFLADYFHTFRSQRSKEVWKTLLLEPVKFYDAVGVGFEILTAGHVFHINFTNAIELLENRFIPQTITNWGDGQFRWAFTISRNFTVFHDKKK